MKTLLLASALLIPTQALAADLDNDGLDDSWEQPNTYVNHVSVYNRGARAGRADVMLYLSPMPGTDLSELATQMIRVNDLYEAVNFTNPDGTIGVRVHYAIGPTIADADVDKSAEELRELYFPQNFRGTHHWFQVYDGSGGNSGFGDYGHTGINFASLGHELGHQLGLDHEGGWNDAWSPLYPSIMNYAFSYSIRGTDDVSFSPNTFAGYSIRETSLSEDLPYRASRFDYLTIRPYKFNVYSTGANSSWIDWNRNGVHDTANVRADVTFGYGTELGDRYRVGDSLTSPWLFTVSGRLFVAYGYATSATCILCNIDIRVREINSNGTTTGLFTAAAGQLNGDPIVGVYNGRVHLFHSTGTVNQRLLIDPIGRRTISTSSFPSPSGFVPTAAGTFENIFVVLLWNRTTKEVRYTYSTTGDTWSNPTYLTTSTVQPGFVADNIGRFVLARGVDMGAGQRNRLSVDFFSGLAANGSLSAWFGGWGNQLIGGSGSNANEWVGLNVAGRLQPLFDSTGMTGAANKILVLGRYESTAGTQAFIVQQVGDTSYNGGWDLKTAYDMWTLTRSSPSWVAYNGDIAYAYRWTDTVYQPNDLMVSFRGSGIGPDPLGDRNDYGAIHDGLQDSLVWVRSYYGLTMTVTH